MGIRVARGILHLNGGWWWRGRTWGGWRLGTIGGPGTSAMGGRTTDQLAGELDDGYGVVAQETADARF